MSFGGASLGTAEGRITVDASQAISELGRVGNMMGTLDAKAGTLGSGVSDFHQSTVGLAQGMQHLGRVGIGLGASLAAPFVGAAKLALDFESTMAGVNAVMDLTGTQFQDLSDLAQQLGKDTIFSGTQAAEGIETLGRAGISFEDIMAGAARGATDLAAAGGIDVPRAAEVMAAAMQAFNIEGEDSVRVADALAGMANQTLTDINQLGIGLGQVAGVANAAGMSLEETTAFIGLMADNGIRGSDAATSMKNAILALLAPTDKAAGIMDGLGISLLDTEGNFIGLAGASQEFFDAWKGSGQTMSQFLQPLEDVLGRDAVRTILFGMQALEDQQKGLTTGWDDYLAAASEAGAASEFAAKRMDSTSGAIEKLRGSLATLGENIGLPIIKSLRAPIDALTEFVNALASLPSSILAPIGAIGVLVGAITALGGAFLLVGGYILEAVARFGAAGVSLGSILGPALAVAAAIAAIGLAVAAYQNDWLGFRGAVDGVADALRGILGIQDQVASEGKRERWDWHEDDATQGDKALTGLEKTLNDVGNTLSRSTVPQLRNVGRWIKTDLIESMRDAQKIWDVFRARGIDPVTSGLRAASKFFSGLGATGVGQFFEDASNATARFGDEYERVVDVLSGLGFNVITVQLQALSQAIAAAFGPNAISDLLHNAAQAVTAFGDAWAGARAVGLNPGAAALAGLAGVAEDFGKVDLAFRLLGAAEAAQKFGDAFALARATFEHAGFTGLSSNILAFSDALFRVTGIDVRKWAVEVSTAIEALSDTFWRAIREGATPFEAAITAIDAALDKFLSPEQQAMLDGLSQQFSAIGEAIRSVAGAGLDRVGQFFNELGTAISTGNMEGVLTAVQSLISDIQTTLQTAGAQAMDWFITIGEPALRGWWEEVKGNAGAWLREKIEGGLQLAGEVLGAITGWWLEVGQPELTGWVQAGGDLIGPQIQALLDFAGDVLGRVFGWLVEVGAPELVGWIQGGADLIGPQIQNLIAFGGETLAKIQGWLLEVGIPVLTGWINTGVGWLRSRLLETTNFAGQTLLNVTGWVLEVGPPVIKEALSAAGNIKDQILTWIDSQIVMPDVSELPSLEQKAQQLGHDITMAIGEALRGAFDAIGGGVGGGAGGLAGGGFMGANLKNLMGGTEASITESVRNAIHGLLEGIGSAITEMMGGQNLSSSLGIDKGAISDAIGSALAELWEVDESFVADATTAGEKIGRSVGEALGSAINSVMTAVVSESISGGSTQAAKSPLTQAAGGGANFGQAFSGFFDSFVESAKTAIEQEFVKAKTELENFVREKRTELFNAAVDELFGDPVTGGESQISAGLKGGAGILSPLADGVPNNMFGPGDAEKIQIGSGQAIQENIGQPAAQGIEDGSIDAQKAMTDAFNLVWQGAQTTPIGRVVEALTPSLGGAEAAGLETALQDAIYSPVADAIPAATEGGIKQIGAGLNSAVATQASELDVVAPLDEALSQDVQASELGKYTEAIGSKIGEATTEATQQIGQTGTEAAQSGAAGAAGSIGAALDDVMSASIAGTTLTTFSQAIGQKIGEAVTQGISQTGGVAKVGTTDGAGAGGIGASIAASLASAVGQTDFSGVGMAIQTKISEALSQGMTTEAAPAGGGVVGGGAGIGASVATAMAAQITTADFTAVGTAISAKIAESVSLGMASGGAGMQAGLGGTGGGGAGIGSAIAASITADIASADFSAAGQAIAEQIGAGMGSATGQIQAALGAVIQSVVASGSQATSGAQQIGVDITTQIGAGIGQGTGTITAAVAASVTAGVAAGQGPAAGAVAIGTAITTNAGAGVGQGTGTLTAAVQAMVQSGIDAGTGAATGATAIGAAVATNAGSGVGQGTGTLVSAVQAMVQVAIDGGVGAAAGASAIGAAISSGAASGVILDALVGPVTEMVNAGIAAGMAAAGAASPSKRMMELGEWMSEGLAIGVENKRNEARGAISRTVQDLLGAVKDGVAVSQQLQTLGDELGSIRGMDEFGSAVNSLASEMESANKDVGGNVRDLIKSIRERLQQGAKGVGRDARSVGDAVTSGVSAGAGASASTTTAKPEKPNKDAIKDAKQLINEIKDMQFNINQLKTLGNELGSIRGMEEFSSNIIGIADSMDTEKDQALKSAITLKTGLKDEFRAQMKDYREETRKIGKAIADGVTTGITEGTAAATTAATGLGDDVTGGLNANLSRLPEMGEAMGEGVGTGVSDGMNSTIPAVQGSGEAVGQALDTGLNTGASGVDQTATDIVTDATTAMDTAAQGQSDFARTIGELISATFGDGFASGSDPTAAGKMVTSFHTGIRDAVLGLIPSVQQKGTDIGNAFTTGVNAANPTSAGRGLTDEVNTGLTQGAGNANQMASKAGTQIGNSLTSGIEDACAPANSAGADLTESCIPKGIDSGLKDATSTAEDAGKSVSDSLMDGLNIKKKDVEKNFGNAGTGFTKSMATGIGSQVQDAIGAANTVAKKAGEVDGTAEGKSIGVSIGQGIKAGIASMVSEIAQEAANAVKKAEEAAKKEADSKSPSRVFAAIGQDLSLGLAVGMRERFGAIEDAAGGMITSAADMLQGDAFSDAERAMVAGIGDYTTSMLSAFDKTAAKLNDPRLLNRLGDAGVAGNRAVGTKGVTTSEGGMNLTINGFQINPNTPEGRAMIDLAGILRQTAGQYASKS